MKANGTEGITALIRFKNSADTLPAVLEALAKQSRPVTAIVGVDTGSSDGSRALLEAAGAMVVDWRGPYHASAVLNLGCRACQTDRILFLSSHTVIEDHDIIERLAGLLEEERTAAASVVWDADPFYSDAINQREIAAKGLKFGSIYTNSLGLIWRDCWAEAPFDEGLRGLEDYGWALDQLARGFSVRRLSARFRYQRGGSDRVLVRTLRLFRLAHRHRLPVAWRGARGSAFDLARALPGSLRRNAQSRAELTLAAKRLTGWLLWRWWSVDGPPCGAPI